MAEPLAAGTRQILRDIIRRVPSINWSLSKPCCVASPSGVWLLWGVMGYMYVSFCFLYLFICFILFYLISSICFRNHVF